MPPTDPPRPASRARRALASLRDAAWILVLAVVALFAFFVATGAFSPAEVWGLTAVVLALFAAWCAHAWWQSRHTPPAARRDPDVVRARERRGF